MHYFTKVCTVPVVLGVTWSAIATVVGAQTVATSLANNSGNGIKASVPTPQNPLPPGVLKPFAEIIKDAESKSGFFTVWQKDDKVWLEILPEQLDQPFFFSVNRVAGIGEYHITGSTMLESHIGLLKKVGNSIQFLAQNNHFVPLEGKGVAKAVRQGFSDSLLSAVPVLSQPHPEKKSILIEANALLLSDIPAGVSDLEAVYRQPYVFDNKNSSIERFAVTEDQTTLSVRAHYALAKLILPPLLAPGAPPPPQAPLPANLPDLRSLFLTYQYSFAKLPIPMRPRLADPRLGHFVTTHWDYSHDLAPTPRVHYVNRWRLEKKDPAATLSEPMQPIVFWLDDSIPLQYRDTVREGVLEWNKAFERIGFKNAIVVQQKGENEDVEVMDARHASVSWYLATDASSAVGPRQVDPRTGEILDADIRIADVFTRGARRIMLEQTPGLTGLGTDLHRQGDACDFPHAASAELDFALDLLAMRDGLEPDAPEVEKEARKHLKDVVTHEVGHALGLRHNFRSSTIYNLAQLRDKTFTEKEGIVGSVMDYAPWNLNLEGESPGEYTMTGLGPYDYWAIEYAYKPLAPEVESDELAKIAGRSSEPQLAFATDEDAGGFLGVEGMDPEVNRFDLGNDPLAYYQRRFQLSRELWSRLQRRMLTPGQDYAELRRIFDQGLRYAGTAAKLAAKYIGGVTHLRDFAGTGRAPLTPISPEKQREALRLLTSQVFSVDNFRFSPEFMKRLTVNQLDRGMGRLTSLNEVINPDYSLSTRILILQKEVLDQVMADAVATRILDAETKVASLDKAFQLSELYENLQNAVWSEAKHGRDVTVMRRNLQREHLKRLVALLTRPGGNTPADAKALGRESARGLLVDLTKAAKKPGLNKDSRVHYLDVASILREALQASFQRAGL